MATKKHTSVRKARHPARAGRDAKPAILSDDQLAELLPTLPPVLQKNEVDQIEKFVQANANWAGVARRVCLATASLTGERLHELANSDDEKDHAVLAMISAQVHQYREWLKEYTEIIDAVQARLILAVSYRSDVFDAARKAEADLVAEKSNVVPFSARTKVQS